MNRRTFALVLTLLGALFPLLACGSSRLCPPNEPIYRWKEVPRPYPVIVKVPELGALVLPEYPAHPGHDADEVELKAWALEVKRVAAERDTLRAARIEALELLLRTHNLFEPVNPLDGTPTPHD